MFREYFIYIDNIYRIFVKYIIIYQKEGQKENAMEHETKREKFIRLAERRTNRIIDQLNLLGNLSNTSAYEYTQKDINKMFKAIEEALAESKRKFSRNDGKSDRHFSFDD